MLIEKRKKNYLNFKNINYVIRHPIILKNIIEGKSREEIRANARRLKELQAERLCLQESQKFISSLKKTSPSYPSNQNYQPKLNRLCYIEDWDNKDFKNIVNDFQNPTYEDYIYKKSWSNKTISRRKSGFIHRKDWEWTLGIIAMKRFGKLNINSKAIGVASAHEVILFYLANRLNHVYATDLYEPKYTYTPTDFPENPRKYAPFPYKEDALTALRMDGTKLEFPSDSFDIAFSFSSIEHFGGENHSGALKGLKEIERVLKPGGIAVITTEFMLNNKEHIEFFNEQTIYSDLIDKVERLKLVEPLDLRVTTKTLDTVMDYPDVVKWDTSDGNDEFKKTHPVIIIRVNDILLTSVMLVFQKQ